MVRRFFGFGREVESGGDQEKQVDVLQRRGEQEAVHVHECRSDALLAEGQPLGELQQAVSEKDAHQAAVRVWMLCDQSVVGFVEILADCVEFVAGEEPEALL